MTTKHDLKCKAEFFDAIASGQKNFDVRKLDRAYQRGDIVRLHRYIPTDPKGWEAPTCEPDKNAAPIDRIIEYILTADAFPQGIEPGYGVLGFAVRPVDALKGLTFQAFVKQGQVLRAAQQCDEAAQGAHRNYSLAMAFWDRFYAHNFTKDSWDQLNEESRALAQKIAAWHWDLPKSLKAA